MRVLQEDNNMNDLIRVKKSVIFITRNEIGYKKWIFNIKYECLFGESRGYNSKIFRSCRE